MNGKQAKSLRKLLELDKSKIKTGPSGLFQKEENGPWFFRQRRVPEMNLYRNLKRRYTRGW
jgi:hypothetical protein